MNENRFYLIKSEPLGRLDFKQKHCTSFRGFILINSIMQLLWQTGNKTILCPKHKIITTD